MLCIDLCYLSLIHTCHSLLAACCVLRFVVCCVGGWCFFRLLCGWCPACVVCRACIGVGRVLVVVVSCLLRGACCALFGVVCWCMSCDVSCLRFAV